MTEPSVTARDKFTIGQRVTLSDEGLALFRVRGGHVGGTVVGFGRNDQIVRVLKDGNRTAEGYHRDYWTGAA